MRLNELRQRPGMDFFPATMLIEDCPRIGLPQVVHAKKHAAAGLGKAGLEFQRPSIRGDGFVEPALFPQRVAKIAVSFRVVRLELDCHAIRGDRFIQPRQLPTRLPKDGMKVRGAGCQRDGLADQVHGGIAPARLMRDDSHR